MTSKILDLRGKLPIHNWKKYSQRELADIKSVAIHHSMTTSGNAKSFANYHVNNNGWPGIGYTYVILKDGSIEWCWDMTIKSYHVGNSNKESLGVCLVGDLRKELPTNSQMASLTELIRKLQDILPNKVNVLGHCEYPQYSWKKCPAMDMDNLRQLLRAETIEERVTTLEKKIEIIEEGLIIK